MTFEEAEIGDQVFLMEHGHRILGEIIAKDETIRKVMIEWDDRDDKGSWMSEEEFSKVTKT
jgi:hypothetical protein